MHYLALAVLVFALAAGSVQAAVRSQDVEYRHGDVVLQGYLAWDDAVKGARPGVIVVHQWMGLTDYEKGRARQLAELGYVAFAVDMYGKGVRATSAQQAGALATIYRNDRALMRKIVRLGADGIATNFPDRLAGLVLPR